MATPGRPRKRPSRTYTSYVVELSRDCTKKPCAFAPVYVGQTAHTPEHRVAQHKAGGKLSATKPRLFGVKLRYDLTYMCAWSLWLDLRLLLRSVSTSLSGSGI